MKIQASSGKLYVGDLRPRHLAHPARRGPAALQPAGLTDLSALSNTVGGMGLAAGVTTQLQNSIEAIRKATKRGESPCAGLDALKAQIASFVPKKITTAQRDQLFASIDAIKAENPC